MTELWDLYDRDRIPLGQQYPRSTELPLGTYHLVVYILTFNEKGDLLITLRDEKKDRYPGLWEVTGGSALTGETSRIAACRELAEETGVRAEEDELVLLAQMREGHSHMDFYRLDRDLSPGDIELQPGETIDARWCTIEEFVRMGEEGIVVPSLARRFLKLRHRL